MKKLIFLSFLFTSSALHSATFNIPDGNVTALINAMNTANTNGESDIINLATNGTYVFTTVNHSMTGQSFGYSETDGPIALPFIQNEAVSGRDIILNLNGSVLRLATNAPKMRLIYSLNEVSWEINDGTIKDFESPLVNASSLSGGGGGALVIGESNLFKAESVTFENCKSNSLSERAGGAIYVKGNAEVTFKNSTFRNNVATKHGGAVSVLLAKVRIENCLFDSNVCTIESGAAIYADGCEGLTTDPGGIGEIIGSTFTNNTSKSFGAVFLQGYNEDRWIVRDCQFSNNKATANGSMGGAIWHSGVDNGQFNVSNCTFEYNEAKTHGGAIVCTRGSNNFTNCTFYKNVTKDAGGLGGALYNVGDANSTWFSTIVNCTFAENICGGYGGAWCISDNRGSVKNTIISNNRAYQQCGYPPASGCAGYNNSHNCAGFLTDNGNNIEYPERPNRVANPSYDDPNDKACFSRPAIVASNLMPVIDPLLLVPDFNGGLTKTMALQAESPAINAGSGCSEMDQRGAYRTGSCDIGAYEYAGVLSVDEQDFSDIELVVYPNPSTGEFALKIPEQYQTKKGTIQVFTLDGKLVLEKDLNTSEEGMIRLTEKGTYLLNTIIENQVFSNKVFVY